MKMLKVRSLLAALAFFAAWFCPSEATSSLASVTPIQKVLQLLGGMLEKAKAGKQAEAVEWSAYKTFCSNIELEKQTAIQEADMQKEKLQADKEQHDSEVKRLGEEVDDHKLDVEGWKGEIKKATEDRAAAHKVYKETHADYSESVTAITDAIGVLKKQDLDRPQGSAALLQVLKRAQLPREAKRAIDGFLALGSDFSAEDMSIVAAPEANAYEFQSSAVVNMLVDLKDKFTQERTDLEKKEMIDRQAFETVIMDLENSIEAAENEIKKKTHSKAENKQGSIESSTLFDEVSASRDEDYKYVTELRTTCVQKSSDFEERAKLRGEEIEALEKAIDIISGEKVSGAADKHLPSLLQLRQTSSSLIQFLSPQDNVNVNQQRAAAWLKDAGERLGSHILAAISVKVEDDPFGKVKKLISDLIDRLKKEAAEEADHKAWCDEELKANKQTRKDKTKEVDELTAAIEGLEARIKVLKKDIAVLSAEVSDIVAAVSKASKMRAEEKDTNDQTILEAVEGQTAVAQATKVLSDFYKKAGENTAFTQQEPPIFDEAFKGQQKEGSNVIAFLDVIASDFARLEAETKKAESTAQTEHDKFLDDSDASKKAKDKEMSDKGKEQQDKEQDVLTKKDDLDSAQEQLDAAMAYFDKLKPSCVNTAVPFEDRVKRREEEISALKEALEILNGEGISTGPDALYSSVDGGNLKVDYR